LTFRSPVRSSEKNRFFASCCVMVLPPDWPVPVTLS
jgi:hypothetical protein